MIILCENLTQIMLALSYKLLDTKTVFDLMIVLCKKGSEIKKYFTDNQINENNPIKEINFLYLKMLFYKNEIISKILFAFDCTMIYVVTVLQEPF
jgi:hypothetical protein